MEFVDVQYDVVLCDFRRWYPSTSQVILTPPWVIFLIVFKYTLFLPNISFHPTCILNWLFNEAVIVETKYFRVIGFVNECGAVGEMRIGRENRSTRKKPTPVPPRPSQIAHDTTWD
jgi:hypothetical protein